MQLEGWKQHREYMVTRQPTPRRHFVLAGAWAVIGVAWIVLAITETSLVEGVLGALFAANAIVSLRSARRDQARVRERDEASAQPSS